MQQQEPMKPSESNSLRIILGMFLLPVILLVGLLLLAPPSLRVQSGWLALGMVGLTALLMGRTVSRSHGISIGVAYIGVATWFGWWTFGTMSVIWLPKLTGRLFTILFPITLPPALCTLRCHFQSRSLTNIPFNWHRKYGALMIANIALGHLFWFSSALSLGVKVFLLILGIVAGFEAFRSLQESDPRDAK